MVALIYLDIIHEESIQKVKKNLRSCQKTQYNLKKSKQSANKRTTECEIGGSFFCNFDNKINNDIISILKL